MNESVEEIKLECGCTIEGVLRQTEIDFGLMRCPNHGAQRWQYVRKNIFG